MKSLVTVFASSLLVFAAGLTFGEDAKNRELAASMADAANRFLASLNASELAKATKDFQDPARLDWHNIPKPERKGLQVRDMSTAQRELCHNLLKVSLSQTGYAKAVKIMALEANLREGEKGKPDSPLRDPERYFLTIFGKPAATGTWGWSFEGHHFSLNFVISEGQIIGDTPSFWGANPATVHVAVAGGIDKDIRTLASEEQLGLDLVNSLNDKQRAVAIIAEKAPAEYRNAGKPEPPRAKPEGLAASEMTPEQKKALWSLLDNYCNNLAAPLAEARLNEIKESGTENLYFAWAGSTKPGVGHYYRVQGPTFVLELVNIQEDPQGNKANHVHSVWRSLIKDFGIATK